MPNSPIDLNDPMVRSALYVVGGLVVLLLLVRIWRRGRENAAFARRRAELQKTYGSMQMQQEQVDRLAAKVIATSSTAAIAGFTIVRQIEAVFTDGHQSPNKAVQVLKAMAAEKGANAVINLNGARQPSGKCAASGDAVIVRVESDAAGTARPS